MEQLMDDLRPSLECPVCLSVPRGSDARIFQCVNGHTVCRDCHARVVTCPSCRVQLSRHAPIRSIVAEALAKKFIHQCQFAPQGCSFSAHDEELREHESQCGSRPTSCFHCGTDVEFGKLMLHFRNMHNVGVSSMVKGGQVVGPVPNYSYNNDLDQHEAIADWEPFRFRHDETDFFNVLVRRGETFYTWVYVHGRNPHHVAHTVKIGFASSTLQLAQTSQVFSTDAKIDDVIRHPGCMAMTKRQFVMLLGQGTPRGLRPRIELKAGSEPNAALLGIIDFPNDGDASTPGALKTLGLRGPLAASSGPPSPPLVASTSASAQSYWSRLRVRTETAGPSRPRVMLSRLEHDPVVRLDRVAPPAASSERERSPLREWQTSSEDTDEEP